MVAAALAGRVEEARRTYALYRQIDPDMRLSNLGQRVSFRRREDLQWFIDALALVGVPE